MLGIKLEETRVYQEAKAEGREELKHRTCTLDVGAWYDTATGR